MKKHFHFLTGIGILFLLTLSLSTALAQNTKWTFMVYLGADCDLEPFGIIDFNEMETVGSNSDVQIIVQMDRVPGYDNSNENWTDTRRFRVVQDNNTNTISSPVLQNLGEVNMGDPQELKNFIVWATTNYPAQHYALILWNHGGGWQKDGSKGKLNEMIQRLQQNQKIDGNNPHEVVLSSGSSEIQYPSNPFLNGYGPFRDVVFDQTDNDHLGNAEIGDALAAAGKNIDIMAFDACLMGMIENSYQLRDVAQIMVGSEETEPGDGWPYNTILSELKNNPAMNAETLAASIVAKYGASYAGEPKITQSAVRIAQMVTVAEKLDAFCNAVIDNNQVWNQIDQARENTERFTVPEHRDLSHFMKNVKQLINDNTINTTATEVINAITGAVIQNYVGSGFPESKGVAIYFPDKTNYNSGYGLGNYNIDFPANTKWVDFLQATFNGGSGGGGGSTPDDYEPNDVWALAYGPVENNTPISSYIQAADDIDMFRLLNGTQSQVTLNLTVPADYDLYLFELNGDEMNIITGSENTGTTPEQIVVTLPIGVYYAIVVAYDPPVDQPYQLTVSGLGYDQEAIFDATLAFDYGDAPYETYFSGAGDAIVCLFDPPVAPAKLEKIWLNIKSKDGAQTGGDGAFYIFSFDYYDFLFDPEYVTPPDTGWLYYDLTATETFIYGAFAVGMMYDGENTPTVGYDQISSYGNNLYYIAQEEEWYEDEGTFFVRAEIKFTNPTSGEEETMIVEPMTLSCNPNPVTDMMNIKFNMISEGDVLLEIVDATGRSVMNNSEKNLCRGMHEMQLSSENLKPGLYFCRMKTGGKEISTKLIKR